MAAINLVEKYKEFTDLGIKISKKDITKDEYELYKKQILAVYPHIEEMAIAALTRDPGLLVNATLLLSINIVTQTNIIIPMDIQFKNSNFILVVNPIYLSQLSFNEIVGQYFIESGKILLNHQQHFVRLNSSNKENYHNILERASDVESMLVLKNDVIDSKISNKCATPHIGTYNKNIFEIECGNRSLNYTFKAKEHSFDNIFNFGKKYLPENPIYYANMRGSDGATENILAFEDNINTDTHTFEASNVNEINAKTVELINTVYSSIDSDSRGSMPAAFRETIDEIINKKPVLKWENDFETGVGSMPTDREYTRLKPNRRLIKRIDLSGIRMKYSGMEAVVAIDTSGSITTDDVKRILTEAYNITSKYKAKLTVIECDSKIGRIYEVNNKKDFKLKLTGGGGTAFTPVIKYMNENRKKYKYSTLIYFTDGYGESAIPQPLFKKLIWVILDAETEETAMSRLSVKKPYGVVRPMRKNKENA